MPDDPQTVEARSVPSGDSAVPVTQVGCTGPAVVIIPSIFGVGDDLVEQMREIAAAGGQAWAPDPFFRNDPGVKPFVPPDAAFARIKTLDREQCLADMQAVFAAARAAAGHVIGVGICFGGPFCFLAAQQGQLDGVVTWHGSQLHNHLERADAMRCPVRLHFGAADAFVPPDKVAAVQTAFEGHDEVRIVVHEGADHGFSHRQSPAYEPNAERAGLDDVLALVRALSGT